MRIADVALDADREFFVQNGSSVSATVNDIETVINGVNVIYERDVKTHFTVGTVHTYGGGTDPWTIVPASGTAAALALAPLGETLDPRR